MRALLLFPLLAAAQPVWADYVAATRTIRAREVITEADVELRDGRVQGAIDEPALVVGLEARVALYPGRPVRPGDIGPPALIGRNELVPLVFTRGPVSIETEGRALGRGAAGERIRVMNLASRQTVTGTVRPNGSVEVE